MKNAAVIAIVMASAAWNFAPAAEIPGRWLEGIKGFEKAMELQKDTGEPVIVWTTWTNCPHCNAVSDKIDKQKFKKEIKGAIKVILDEKGKEEEVALCKEKGFKGGNFYVLSATGTNPVATVWAWKPDTRTVVDDLDKQLASSAAAARTQ